MQLEDYGYENSGNIRFARLVLDFLNSCRVPIQDATYWVIKLTRVRADRRTNVVYAAGRSEFGKHVEVVFIEWWKKFQSWLENFGNKIISVRVYANYTPCWQCAPKLKEWLMLNPTVELSLHYAFVYIDLKKPDVEEHLKKLRILRNFRNLAQINKISVDLLTRLTEEVSIGRPGCIYKVSPYVRGIDNEYLEVRINYQRAFDLTDEDEESGTAETHVQTAISEGPCINGF